MNPKLPPFISWVWKKQNNNVNKARIQNKNHLRALVAQMVKKLQCRTPDSIPGSGRSHVKGNGNPLQYPCLGNNMDRVALQATVHGVAKSWTWLSDWVPPPWEKIVPWPCKFGNCLSKTSEGVSLRKDIWELLIR